MTKWTESALDLDNNIVKYAGAEKDNLLVVDGNNLAYRYIKRANYNSYGDDYLQTITSLAKSYSAKRVIVCFDYGKSVYRRTILDNYKTRPPEDAEETKRKAEFFDCLNEIIDDRFPFEYYKMKGCESDDVIAIITKELSNKYTHTWIISSDRDLYQLISDKVSIYSIFSRKEINLDTLYESTKCTPEEYLLAKIIMGDPGDTIKGIEGIGEVRSCGLAINYKTFADLLKNLPIKGTSQYIKNLNSGKDILLRNEKLINLKYSNEALKAASVDVEKFIETLKENI